jgi:hypothetical protein
MRRIKIPSPLPDEGIGQCAHFCVFLSAYTSPTLRHGLGYIPSVSGGEAAVNSAAAEMKKAGMLNSTTDIPGLVKNAFVHLKGVSDEWLQTVQVDKVAGGNCRRIKTLEWPLRAQLPPGLWIWRLAVLQQPSEGTGRP